MEATAPGGNPLQKLCLPMWWIRPKCGAPFKKKLHRELLAKFVSTHVTYTAPSYTPLPMWKLLPQGGTPWKMFHFMWQLQSKVGTPWKYLFLKGEILENKCVRPCGRYGPNGGHLVNICVIPFGSYYHKGGMPWILFVIPCGSYAPKRESLEILVLAHIKNTTISTNTLE